MVPHSGALSSFLIVPLDSKRTVDHGPLLDVLRWAMYREASVTESHANRTMVCVFDVTLSPVGAGAVVSGVFGHDEVLLDMLDDGLPYSVV